MHITKMPVTIKGVFLWWIICLLQHAVYHLHTSRLATFLLAETSKVEQVDEADSKLCNPQIMFWTMVEIQPYAEGAITLYQY